MTNQTFIPSPRKGSEESTSFFQDQLASLHVKKPSALTQETEKKDNTFPEELFTLQENPKLHLEQLLAYAQKNFSPAPLTPEQAKHASTLSSDKLFDLHVTSLGLCSKSKTLIEGVYKEANSRSQIEEITSLEDLRAEFGKCLRTIEEEWEKTCSLKKGFPRQGGVQFHSFPRNASTKELLKRLREVGVSAQMYEKWKDGTFPRLPTVQELRVILEHYHVKKGPILLYRSQIEAKINQISQSNKEMSSIQPLEQRDTSNEEKKLSTDEECAPNKASSHSLPFIDSQIFEVPFAPSKVHDKDRTTPLLSQEDKVSPLSSASPFQHAPVKEIDQLVHLLSSPKLPSIVKGLCQFAIKENLLSEMPQSLSYSEAFCLLMNLARKDKQKRELLSVYLKSHSL